MTENGKQLTGPMQKPMERTHSNLVEGFSPFTGSVRVLGRSIATARELGGALRR